MTLQQRLNEFTADAIGKGLLPPPIVETMKKATGELVASGQAGRAVKAGDPAPNFSLPNADGETISLSKLLASGPVVITFYRGVWCPYCNFDLQALEAARAEIEARGASLVALSMQSASNSRKAQRDNDLNFPILVDHRGDVAAQFGLRFALPDYLIDVYKNVFGNDLEQVNGESSWSLPMPARYVVGQDGVVAYAEVNPDYTQRPDPSELFPVLDALVRNRAR